MRGILVSLCWRELVARAYYQVEPLALYRSYKLHNHRYELQARTSGGSRRDAIYCVLTITSLITPYLLH